MRLYFSIIGLWLNVDNSAFLSWDLLCRFFISPLASKHVLNAAIFLSFHRERVLAKILLSIPITFFFFQKLTLGYLFLNMFRLRIAK